MTQVLLSRLLPTFSFSSLPARGYVQENCKQAEQRTAGRWGEMRWFLGCSYRKHNLPTTSHSTLGSSSLSLQCVRNEVEVYTQARFQARRIHGKWDDENDENLEEQKPFISQLLSSNSKAILRMMMGLMYTKDMEIFLHSFTLIFSIKPIIASFSSSATSQWKKGYHIFFRGCCKHLLFLSSNALLFVWEKMRKKERLTSADILDDFRIFYIINANPPDQLL